MAEGNPDHKDEHLGSEGFDANPALFTRGSTQEAELVHVLFIDLIGYSLLKTDQGSEMVEELFSLVRQTPEFKRAQERNQLLLLPSGDGTAIVFFQVPPAAPVRCALEIARAIESHPEIKLRMGVNSGPVLRITDIKGEIVVAGAGINYAQRAMDCGDAGHILLTKATAEVLLETRWANSIHDLGEFQVKHGKRLHLYNVCRAGLGNPAPPTRNRVQPSAIPEAVRPPEQPPPPATPGLLKRILSLLWRYPKTSCLTALLAIAILLVPIFQSPETTAELSIMPLEPGGRASVVSPQISPDGKHFIYARKDAGKWDIYMRDFDMSAMKNAPVKLTQNMLGDNIQPSFSPDGKVVFASERGPVFSKGKLVPSDEIGGLFSVDPGNINLGATRLTERGYNPAWSPDGKKIAYGMESIVRPEDRTTILSQLSCLDGVDVDTRVETSLASAPDAYKGDAVQPAWSPHGTRLAFWFTRNGHRDIGTVRSDGTDFVQVTNDAFLDWNPVWSPDGYLYFASDRGGDGIHLWRALVNETSGKVQGPFTELRGSPPDPEYLSFSRDGRTVTFVQRVFRSDLYKVSFDPLSCRVGRPIEIRSDGRASRPDVSSDGKFVVFDTAGTKSDNISTINTATLELQSLSSDAYMNRGPRWSRDDKQIAFFSNRGGSFQIWTLPASGSGEAKQLSDLPGFHAANFLYPVWSPVDDRIAFTRLGETPAEYQTFILRIGQGGERRMFGLPKLHDLNVSFVAWSWSPDGHTLAGYRQRSDGKFMGIMTYNIDRNEFMPPLTHFGSDPVWLNDGSKRLLFLHKGQIYIVDSSAKEPESGVRPVLSAEDNGQDFEVGRRGFSLSRDNRLIYFSRQETRTVLYLATLVSSDTAHRGVLERVRSLFSR